MYREHWTKCSQENAICGLSLLLVLSFAPRGFSPGTPVFPSPQKPTLPNSNFDLERTDTFKRVHMEFGSVGFWGEGKTGEPGEKPLGARERTNNKLNPHMVSTAGFEPWQCGRRALSPLRHPCSLEQSNSVPTFLGQMQTGCRWLGTKYTYQRNETLFLKSFRKRMKAKSYISTA